MTVKRFFIHLLFMFGFVMLVLLGILLWLQVYTNHGQKLKLPDYRGSQIENAKKEAEEKSFQIIVNDSLYKVGVQGGQILTQNPVAGSLVKENRKVYVDISRYNATVNNLADLPVMYGREYNSVKRSLTHLEIESNITNYRHDIGEPDHILEVWYDGQLIDGRDGRKNNVKIKTGGTIDFVLSAKQGGSFQIPDLVCKRLNIAKWQISRIGGFKLGHIEKRGAIQLDKMDSTFVISQFPPFQDSMKIPHGSTIDIVVQQSKPDNCRSQ